jgi:A/G-specific adenine glycosylase
MPDPLFAQITLFHNALKRWYRRHGRHDLPWRNTRDPYAIYISEIMLQQTQVETVRSRFYAPFLKQFPTLEALADASQEEILSAWQGLGYYSRARNLHAAAQQSKGRMPVDADGLMALPGIGRNTAHAVAAFAYHQPLAVMEANVKRVLCRIFALKNPAEKELWEYAQALLNESDPFDYNQAMMDIGSMVCTKRAPKCGECPANKICKGQKNPESYPAAKTKKSVPVRKKNILLFCDEKGRIMASPRATRFLQGMYHFHEQEAPPPKSARKIGELEQSYSHFTLQAQIWLVKKANKSENNWFELTQLYTLPMSMAEKKILRILASHAKSAA